MLVLYMNQSCFSFLNCVDFLIACPISSRFAYLMSRVKHRFSDSESDYELEDAVRHNQSEDNDDFSSLSFAALSAAQEKLRSQDKLSRRTKTTRKTKKYESESESNSDSESYSDDEPESTSSRLHDGRHRKDKRDLSTPKRKHAPSEASSKKAVSKVREIPGLKNPKSTSLYKDIRFDAAYGKADWSRIRKDYAFLDDYRQKEIEEMSQKLKDRKKLLKLSERQVENMKLQIQSLQSRLDTLKNRDLANKIAVDHKKEQMKLTRTGKQSNPYFLKKSEQRKLIQKAKFESMKAPQREKIMERKRKRRLGKEFKQLEFRGHGQ